MGKTLIITAICAIISWSTYAQDYQTFKSERTVLFEKLDGNIKSIRIDSVHIQNTDSILFPFTNIQNIGNDSDCYTPYGSSWIGTKIIIQEDADNLFFNKMGDTIRIKTNAAQNESWLAFCLADSTQIMATITNHDTLTFLGVNDSVKTISFQVFNSAMLPVDHILDDMDLILSKNYGFVKNFNFYLFPSIEDHGWLYTDTLEVYNLVGVGNPQIGLQNLNWLNINDYQVGDELHIRSNYESYAEQYNRTKLIKKYIERINFIDSIFYKFERKKLTQISIEGVTDSSYIHDTVSVMIYKYNSEYNPALPNYPIGGKIQELYSSNGRLVSSLTIPLLQETGTECWEWYWSSCYDYSMQYIQGLGGPYYNGYVCFPDVISSKLVYYKKGTEEWGTPIYYTTSISGKKEPAKILVYPNPVKDVVLIERTSQEILAYKLIDLSGKIMLAGRLTQKKETINLNPLDAGVYFLIAGEQKLKIIKK